MLTVLAELLLMCFRLLMIQSSFHVGASTFTVNQLLACKES